MLIFKVGTLARHLRVHRNTVTNWIKKGTLPAASSAAKRYAISKKAFLSFCERQKISKEVMDAVVAELSALPAKEVKAPLAVADHGNREKAVPVPESKNRIGAVMVVGGGIAGIQAALDLADSGFYVYLI